MNCKITNSKLDPFMSFGKMPLANGFITKDQFDNEFFFEMNVCFNENLSLLQLGNHPKPEKTSKTTVVLYENKVSKKSKKRAPELHFASILHLLLRSLADFSDFF